MVRVIKDEASILDTIATSCTAGGVTFGERAVKVNGGLILCGKECTGVGIATENKWKIKVITSIRGTCIAGHRAEG